MSLTLLLMSHQRHYRTNRWMEFHQLVFLPKLYCTILQIILLLQLCVPALILGFVSLSLQGVTLSNRAASCADHSPSLQNSKASLSSLLTLQRAALIESINQVITHMVLNLVIFSFSQKPSHIIRYFSYLASFFCYTTDNYFSRNTSWQKSHHICVSRFLVVFFKVLYWRSKLREPALIAYFLRSVVFKYFE